MSRGCNHGEWLALSTQDNETTLWETDRLQVLIDQLPYPDAQKPTLFFLIGNVEKSKTLRELVSAKKSRRSSRRRRGAMHLHMDADSIFYERPILFAEGNIIESDQVDHRSIIEHCHEITARNIQQCDDSRASDVTYFLPRLLSPFADVFCFFADLASFRPIVRHLGGWLETSKTLSIPISIYPRILVVIESIQQRMDSEKLLKELFFRMLEEETSTNTSGLICLIDVLCIRPEGRVSSGTNQLKLRDQLMKSSDSVRRSREEHCTLFSATHMAGLFKHASQQIEKAEQPFNLIAAARTNLPLTPDRDIHLTNFLQKVGSTNALLQFGVPVIASSLLLDAYPPDSHLFLPRHMFHTLYEDVCYKAARVGTTAYDDSKEMMLPSGLVQMVQDQFAKYFREMVDHTDKPAAKIHLDTLKIYHSYWRGIQGHDTCYVCLSRRPQYGHPCGHFICDNCVRIFGEKSLTDRWGFQMQKCILCGSDTSGMVVRVIPDTAGIGVLSIDGGGVKGVIPLKVLKVLQDKLPLSIPIQEFFQVAFGTSSGGLTVCAMFLNGWSIEDCAQSFESLAEVAFAPRMFAHFPILSFVLSYLADGLYPPKGLEEALRQVFGSHKSISDCSYATSIGAKVGVPTATISDPSSCIFTNYNGIGERRGADTDYHVITPQEGHENIPLWKVARCGSAAPWYFPPKHIEGVGTFQDPGVLENNPIALAVSEAAIIFPTVENPDFIVSLGTGVTNKWPEDLHMSSHRGIWKDGFIPRLLRAFMKFIVGGRLTSEVKNERLFRFNGKYDGNEASLDDFRRIPDLKRCVDQVLISEQLEEVVRYLIASLFYFELEDRPKKDSGQYICAGHIWCRLHSSRKAFGDLHDYLLRSSAKFHIGQRHMDGPGIVDREGNWRKRVEFKVSDKSSRFSILLKEGPFKTNISGSPFTLDRLETLQGLDCVFGRRDHRKRKHPGELDLLGWKRRRLQY